MIIFTDIAVPGIVCSCTNPGSYNTSLQLQSAIYSASLTPC